MLSLLPFPSHFLCGGFVLRIFNFLVSFFCWGERTVIEQLIRLAKFKTMNTQYTDKGTRDRFYQSQTWRNKRAAILERDHHECQVCRSIGKVSLVKLIVHHKRTLEFHPELAMDDGNLVTVCQSCHNKIHGLTEKEFNDEWW